MLYDQLFSGYALFRHEADKDKPNTLIDLSAIPRPGQEYRTAKAAQLYKHYTSKGDVYIVVHGFFASQVARDLYKSGIPKYAVIIDSDTHSIEDECQSINAIYKEKQCGVLHCVCNRAYVMEKVLYYSKFGILPHIHSIQTASDETGYDGAVTQLSHCTTLCHC